MSAQLPEAGYDDDQRLVRYLLGLLPDEAAEHLDELSILDHELAWRLRAAETDLVEDPPLFRMIRVMVGCARRPRAKLAEPPLVVPCPALATPKMYTIRHGQPLPLIQA